MTDLDPRQRIQLDMVEVLQRSPALSTETRRTLFWDRLADLLDGLMPARTQAPAGSQIGEIVRSCATHPDGLPALVAIHSEFEPQSVATMRLAILADEWDVVTQLPAHDWGALRAELGSLIVPDLAELCRLATASRISTLPRFCRTPWDVLVYLFGATTAPGGLPPWLAFLDYAALWMDPESARRARALTQQLTTEWDLTEQLDEARRRSAAGRGEAAGIGAYLVFQIEPDPVDPERYTLSYWHQWDPYDWRPERGNDRAVHRGNLERAVEDVVGDMEAAWGSRSGAVRVEFVLPPELLNEPVEWWSKDSITDPPVPLTRDYEVVVRSLERLRDRPWHRVWHQRWTQFDRRPAASETFLSLPGGDEQLRRLHEELRSDDRIVALVLSEPPRGERGGREIRAALRFGLPVVIWHRLDCSAAAFRQAVADLLADGGLAQLPARARLLRLQALGLSPERREHHVGRHLSVLWDDPTRLPTG